MVNRATAAPLAWIYRWHVDPNHPKPWHVAVQSPMSYHVFATWREAIDWCREQGW